MAEQMLISTLQLTNKQAHMKINLSSPAPLGKKSAAFSLLEVVFGMAISGTVVGAMVSGITNGTFTMRMALAVASRQVCGCCSFAPGGKPGISS